MNNYDYNKPYIYNKHSVHMQLFTINVDAVLLGCDAEVTCGVTPALQTKTYCLYLQGSGGVGGVLQTG
jgi:hypothetical protein